MFLKSTSQIIKFDSDELRDIDNVVEQVCDITGASDDLIDYVKEKMRWRAAVEISKKTGESAVDVERNIITTFSTIRGLRQ